MRVRHAFQLRFGENDRRLHGHDVGLEIGLEFRQFLAQFLDLGAFLRRKREPGAAIIAQSMLEQERVLAFQLRLGVGISLDRLVNILAIIDPDRPILENLDRFLGRVAHRGVLVGLLNDDGLADRDLRVVLDVIDRADRACESHFGQILLADRVERGVGFGDRGVDVALHLDRRLWPLGNGQDLVRLFGGGLKIGETFDVLGAERKGEGRGERLTSRKCFIGLPIAECSTLVG